MWQSDCKISRIIKKLATYYNTLSDKEATYYTTVSFFYNMVDFTIGLRHTQVHTYIRV